MGSDKILMPNIPCTGSILTSFKGESHGERNCQFFFLICFVTLNSSWISSQSHSFNSQHEDMITFFKKPPNLNSRVFAQMTCFHIKVLQPLLNITGHWRCSTPCQMSLAGVSYLGTVIFSGCKENFLCVKRSRLAPHPFLLFGNILLQIPCVLTPVFPVWTLAQNLTEFNTAHNKRISTLTIEEGNLDIQRPQRKRKNSRVTFSEDDEIINPGEVSS